MRKHWSFIILFILGVLASLLAGCAPAMTPTQALPTSVPVSPIPTQPAMTQPPPAPSQAVVLPTSLPMPEARQVELEYPAKIELGDSDVIRLTLAPSQIGYTVQAEFPEHQTSNAQISVARPSGYDLFAVARLDGVAFDLSPQGDQVRSLPQGETLTWNWSLTARQSGRQRLALTLLLRWVPTAVSSGAVREAVLFSRGLEVQVSSILGLPPSQAGRAGLILLITIGLTAGGFFFLRRTPTLTQVSAPNTNVAIETTSGLQLAGEPESLLKSLFPAYARLLVTHEFLSGYSGARTFLAQPIRPDGRADAYTIVKIGNVQDVEREFANYETFIKDTLPPITARIQHSPIRLRHSTQAAMRYTFIGEAGRAPVSLRQAFLADPDPKLLSQLFATFGPYWWQQRRPYTFHLGSDYDRLLPVHYVLIPERGRGRDLDGVSSPDEIQLATGELIHLRHFQKVELRADRQSYSLTGTSRPGQPPLRLRWLSLERPEGATGRVTATRVELLAELVMGMELFGLPNPLPRLPGLLAEAVHGTQSIIHGDLNLENILVGPGDLVWLIDFAQTREGHTLLDFAHLEAEIIGRVLPAYVPSAQEFFKRLPGRDVPLLPQIESIASQCLFDPANPREYHLALAVTCLGALKFATLEPAGRHLLYLTAAYLIASL